jgi:antitoxin ParD1/3/4
MWAMNISLTPELERRISEKIESGLYGTASEVVREALRRLFESDLERERSKARFEEEIRDAIEELDRGEGLDGEAVFEELRLHLESKAKRG